MDAWLVLLAGALAVLLALVFLGAAWMFMQGAVQALTQACRPVDAAHAGWPATEGEAACAPCGACLTPGTAMRAAVAGARGRTRSRRRRKAGR